MAKVVNFVVGAAALAVGLAAGGAFTPLIMAGASMLFSSAMSLLLTPKPKPRDATQFTLQLGEVPRQAVFGETAVPGSLVDAFNYGGKYGTDWEVLIVSVADHRCHSLTGFFVDNTFHAFSADGAVAGYSSQLMVWWRDGSPGQTMPSVVTANGPGWSGGANWGKGTAYIVFAYKADDPEAKNPVWPGGRPRFLPVVKGKLCYDPRKDSTVAGGSGSHRWTDPATWEWTDNLIVARYNWSRGVYALDQVEDLDMLLVGRGLSAEEQPPEKAFAPANLCDELVDGEKRYRADGVIAATTQFLEVEEQFAAACAGVIVTREGSVEIEPGQAKAPSFFFTDRDLIVGSEVEWNESIPSEADREWVNTVIPRYVEPSQRWGDHAAPVRRDVADVIADGGPREETLPLAMVKHAKQAGRVGEIRRRLGRLWGRGAVTLGPRFVEVQEGDIGVWTSPRRFGGGSRTVRVDGYARGKDWHKRLQLREINSSVYSEGDFIPDQSATDQGAPPPEIGQPGASAWTLTAAQLSAGGAAVPALVIAGAIDDPRAREVRFEYWRSPDGSPPGGSAEWIDAGLLGPSVKRREIAAVAPGAVYYAGVTYLVDGVPGDRRVLGPVTAQAPVVGAGDVDGLGDLATQDEVDFATQVTGPDKPAAGATKNREFRQTTDPALNPANGVVDGDGWTDTSTSPQQRKIRIGGTWQTSSNYVTGTGQLVDTAELGKKAIWGGPYITGTPPELLDGRVAEGLDATGKIVKPVSLVDQVVDKSLGNLDSAANAKLGGIEPGATSADSLLKNGDLRTGTEFWYQNPTSAAVQARVVGTAADPVPAYWRFTNGAGDIRANNQEFIGVNGGSTLYLSAAVRRGSAAASFIAVGIWQYNAVGTLLANPQVQLVPDTANVWALKRGKVTLHSNAATMRVFVSATLNSANTTDIGTIRLAYTEKDATLGSTIGTDVKLPDGSTAPASRVDNDQVRITGSAGQLYVGREISPGNLANIDAVNLSEAGIAALAYKSAVNLASSEVTNKSLANLDGAAATKLGGIAPGAGTVGLLKLIGTGSELVGNTLRKVSGAHGVYQGGAVGAPLTGTAFVSSGPVRDPALSGGWYTVIALDASATNFDASATTFHAIYVASGAGSGTLHLRVGPTSVASQTVTGITQDSRLLLGYKGASIFASIGGVTISYSTGITAGLTLYPKWLDFHVNSAWIRHDLVYGPWSNNAWSELEGSGKPENNATDGAQIDVNLRKPPASGGGVVVPADVLNTDVRVTADAGIIYIADSLDRAIDSVPLSEAGIAALAYKSAVNLASSEVTGKSLANLDSAASTKLGGIAAGATVGATWGTNVAGRPAELTDGRIAAGLAANGDVARAIPTAVKTSSNILSRAGGGTYIGELDAEKTAGKSLAVLTDRTADNIAESSARKWAGESQADITRSIIGPPRFVVAANHLGQPQAGQLPASGTYTLIKSGSPVASGVSWAYRVRKGVVNGHAAGSTTYALTGSGAVEFELTAIGAKQNEVELLATEGGTTRPGVIEIAREDAAPPQTGGGGGSGSGSTQTSGFNSMNSASAVVISSELPFTTGPGGTVTVEVGLTATLAVDPGAGTRNIRFEVQRWNGSSWVAIGSVFDTDPDPCWIDDWETSMRQPSPGSASASRQATGLGASTSGKVRLVAWHTVAADSTAYFFGSVSVTVA